MHTHTHTHTHTRMQMHAHTHPTHTHARVYVPTCTYVRISPNAHRYLHHITRNTYQTTCENCITSFKRDSFSWTTPLTVMATVKSHANVITIGSTICMAIVYLQLEWKHCSWNGIIAVGIHCQCTFTQLHTHACTHTRTHTRMHTHTYLSSL